MASSEIHILRHWNESTVIYFPLIDAGAQDFEATPVTVNAAECQYSIDGGVFGNTASQPAHEGNGIYSLAITAAELKGKHIVITIIDTAVKAWEDKAIIIDTFLINGEGMELLS